MPAFMPPVDDALFLWREVFGLDEALATLYPKAEVNSELALGVLGAAGQFCTEILQPLNATGDQQGCALHEGAVTTPRGFPDAYQAFVADGWPSLSSPEEFGGQDLPRVLQLLVDEMVSATNLSFGLFAGLTRGAVEALGSHASPELKATYLPHMVSGLWTGVMALTESGAGTDLGMLKAQARPNGDGSHAITGTKIFISSGDHDFGGNVIHLVLARLPDAPAGVKGISLFLVPKFLSGAAGDFTTSNALQISALEHKMGIHAQPTCVVNYEGARGWLVGEPHRGLNAMFTMMNAERLYVGVQGLGLAEGAYQMARAYAAERLQGRSPDGLRAPVPIIEHPDVRRMLLTVRTFVEGGRALMVWTALQMDTAARHPDKQARAAAEGFVALVTPVVKAAYTDLGFECCVMAQQVFGGHGYVRETGIEQFVRDARITQIYEGTNGVQALDLAARKLFVEGGVLPNRLFDQMAGDLLALQATGHCRDVVAAASDALADLRRITSALQGQWNDPMELGAAATDYLRLFALVLFAWMWARMAVAAEALPDASGTAAAKPALARFFMARLLPASQGLARAIESGAGPVLALDAAQL